MSSWKESRQRRDEMRAAFEEGFKNGSYDLWDRNIDQAWRESRARQKLATLPVPDRCPSCGGKEFQLAVMGEFMLCATCIRPVRTDDFNRCEEEVCDERRTNYPV